MSQVGFFLFIGDYIKDTRALDLASRGAWMDLLCLLYEKQGSITWPMAEVAQYLGCDLETCHTIVTRLSRQNTCDVTLDGHDNVTLTSRRIVRDIKAKDDARLRKQASRERQSRHRDVTSGGHSDVTPLNPSHKSESESLLSQKSDSCHVTKPDLTVHELVNSWNSCFTGKLPAVEWPLSASRSRKAAARLREHQSIDFWQRVWDNINTSKFLLGRNNGTWRCNLDFVIANDSNCIKIYEGAYNGERTHS